jgi:hypothetical protein
VPQLLSDGPNRRVAVIVWAIIAIAGSIGVWWLSSYLETLTSLAQTDRAAALELFRTRAMPALLLVVAVAVAAGAVVMHQGLQVVRGEDPRGRRFGAILAAVGFVLAAVPLVLISVVFWLLSRARA